MSLYTYCQSLKQCVVTTCRAVIDAGIASLKAFSPGGGTRLALGLQLVSQLLTQLVVCSNYITVM